MSTPANILILEDDPDQSTLMCDALSIDGHICFTAQSVDEAEQILSQGHIQLALLDMNLPGRTGLEALQFMRNTPSLSAVPAIVVTANHQFQQQAEELGADLFLVKPVNIGQMRTLVQRCLRAS